jgi:hypothetical protein
MLIFVLHVIRQVDKYIHLIVNMKETNQKKFLHIIPYQQVFFLKFKKLFHEDLNYYHFHLNVIIFLDIS